MPDKPYFCSIARENPTFSSSFGKSETQVVFCIRKKNKRKGLSNWIRIFKIFQNNLKDVPTKLSQKNQKILSFLTKRMVQIVHSFLVMTKECLNANVYDIVS